MDNQQTIVDLIDGACAQFATNIVFTCMGKSLTYAQLGELSDAFANYLLHHSSLKPGDRIAVQLPNILQYPVVVFGAIKAGLVVVNTNPLYTQRELTHQLNDSGAKALVVLSNVATVANQVVGDTAVESVIVTDIADLHGFPRKQMINFVARHIKKLVPLYHFSQQVSLSDALSRGAAVSDMSTLQQRKQSVALGDVAVLQYTGGTTGVAKGAMLTHNNLVCNSLQVQEAIADYLRPAQEVYVAPLPLYHIYAFTLHCLLLARTGNESLLIPNPRDISAFVKTLRTKRLTGFIGLNTLFNALTRNKDFCAIDWSSLRVTCSGGMALTQEAAKRWYNVTGVRICEGYGLTETSPVVSCNPPEAIQPGTVGLPVRDTQVKVVNSNGESLPVGEPGELCVKGPQVMLGYWQRPEATAEIIDTNGWLHTGDVAVIQEDGYIRIVDRIKDMILVSGFNVYPNEIEDILNLHPKIHEVAAVGVSDANTGEAVKLFIVKNDPSLTETEVKQYCREQLTGYKRPHYVEFVDDLPKSNVGKVLRKALRGQ